MAVPLYCIFQSFNNHNHIGVAIHIYVHGGYKVLFEFYSPNYVHQLLYMGFVQDMNALSLTRVRGN